MQDLHFARPCTFTDASGETRVFAAGRYPDVEDEIANHWFVQAHLVKDSGAPEVPETAPLQHEERVKMKAALDAADGRAKGSEAERDAALARAEAAETENADLKTSITDLTARIAELEEAASDAAKKASGAEAKPDDAPRSEDDDDEFEGKPYGIKRRFQGKFAVVKHSDDSVAVDSLSKTDAKAKARELNAQA